MKRSLLKGAAWIHRRAWRLRAVTLGVRAVVLDGDAVLLVRHTYVPGWFLPGGGVDRGEAAEAAVRRELREEAGVECLGRPELLGLYRNGRHDHVACYLVRDFTRSPRGKTLVREIAEAKFFSLDALPPDTTAATRSRLAEVLHGEAQRPDW